MLEPPPSLHSDPVVGIPTAHQKFDKYVMNALRPRAAFRKLSPQLAGHLPFGLGFGSVRVELSCLGFRRTGGLESSGCGAGAG